MIGIKSILDEKIYKNDLFQFVGHRWDSSFEISCFEKNDGRV